MSSIKKTVRRFTHGWLPYRFANIFNPSSPALPYYEYIMKHGYERHLFTFRDEYDRMDIQISHDSSNGLKYIITGKGRRLYFCRAMSDDKIIRLYRTLIMEQDIRSPHHYMDSPDEACGYTFVDVGCAEGIVALDVIDKVEHAYLFECDNAWAEALEVTFAPWKDKVSIIPKYVGNCDNDITVRLDTFFSDTNSRLFIKMDIEGAESAALAGAKKILHRPDVEFAVCTYHNNDTITVPAILDKYGCIYTCRKGYFRGRLRNVVVRGHSREI